MRGRSLLSRLLTAPAEPGAGALVRRLNFLAMLALACGLLGFSIYLLTDRAGWRAVANYRRLFIDGWLLTVGIALCSLLLSTLVGLLLATLRRSPILPLHYAGRIYVETIRGTPLLVQILLLYYGIFNQVGIENRTLSGILILSGFSGAYISEVIRAGLESIGQSQLESARAIGLTTAQTYRYVIFPQALRQILPPLAGQFADLVKNSSLLSVIALNEFTQNAQIVGENTFSKMESYVPLAAGYLVLTLPISLWTQRLEKKHRFET